MADIIPLDDKIEVAREKKAAVRRQQKAVTVRRVVQCTGCRLKCEKCETSNNDCDRFRLILTRHSG